MLQFGENGRLVGTLATGSGSRVGNVGLLLYNAGVIPRTGPHRLNVRLARRLAELDLPSLRFDLSSCGDSRHSVARGAGADWITRDLRLAIDCLVRETGVTRIALGGLCSGADNGYATALVDTRVVGLMLLDPWSWSTPGSRRRALRARITELGPARATWRLLRRALRAALDRCRRLLPQRREQPADPFTIRHTPTREEFGRGLESLLDRGVAVQAVYSGSLGDSYNGEQHFDECFAEFRLPGRVTVAWWPHANHTFTELAVQRELIERIATWAVALREREPGATRVSRDATT